MSFVWTQRNNPGRRKYHEKTTYKIAIILSAASLLVNASVGFSISTKADQTLTTAEDRVELSRNLLGGDEEWILLDKDTQEMWYLNNMDEAEAKAEAKKLIEKKARAMRAQVKNVSQKPTGEQIRKLK